MPQVEQIKQFIESLSREEFALLRKWFSEKDWEKSCKRKFHTIESESPSSLPELLTDPNKLFRYAVAGFSLRLCTS